MSMPRRTCHLLRASLLAMLLASCCCGIPFEKGASTDPDALINSDVGLVADTDAGTAAVGTAAAAAAAEPSAGSDEAVKIHTLTSPNSDRQAMLLFRRIRKRGAGFGMAAVNLTSTEPGDDDTHPAAVCGTNSLMSTDNKNDCRISMTWKSKSNGKVLSAGDCTAFRISERHLGTAGHCVYNFGNGANGWAATIDVFCNGLNGCSNSRIAYVTNMVVPPAWSSWAPEHPSSGNGYDMAVIKLNTATFGVDPYKVGMYTASSGAAKVRVSGYPGSGTYAACSQYDGCTQYSSIDTLNLQRIQGFLWSNTIDWCNGHSGSGVSDSNGKSIIGVVSSSTDKPYCINLVAPQVNSNTVNANSCQASGTLSGTSLKCLMGKIP